MIGLPLNNSLKVFSAFILEEKRTMSNFNKLPHGIFLNFEFKRQVKSQEILTRTRRDSYNEITGRINLQNTTKIK